MLVTNHLCLYCGKQLEQRHCGDCDHDSLLNGRYGLIAPISQRPGSVVWRAVDTTDATEVVIKELSWRVGDQASRTQAMRAKRLLQELQHPGLPNLITHCVIEDRRMCALYLVEDFIDGITLEAECVQHRYSVVEVLDIIEELLGILVYLHECSPAVIHRDIKPSNIIRDRQTNRLILIDFTSAWDEAQDPMLDARSVSGTFGYMAPEQFQGVADPRTDLYGVGALAVALLTRKEPHTLLDHNHQLVWAEKLHLPPAVRTLLCTLLAPQHSKRHASARAARSALRAARSQMDGQEHLRITAQPSPPPSIEVLLRRVVREELGSALQRPTPPSHDAPPVPTPRPSPMLPVAVELPLRARRGWWEPQPMTPAQRQRPTHPAVQLVLTAGVFGVVGVGVQLMMGLML